MYHLHGPLEPADGQTPSFAQLWIYDPEYSNAVRCSREPTLDPAILGTIVDDLQHVNPYIQMYKTARERLAEYQNRSTPHSIYLTGTLQLVTEQGLDKRRFNLLTLNKVTTLIPN